MSFDAAFDFTGNVNRYNVRVTALTAQLADVNVALDTCNAIIGFGNLKSARLAVLQRRKASLETMLAVPVDKLQAITGIRALRPVDKLKLVRFFPYTGLTNEEYKPIVLHNYAAMVADADISALITDNLNTDEIKGIIGAELIGRYTG